MKTLIAALALTVAAGTAFAAEGNGDPFPYQAPGITTSLQGYKQAAGANQNPFPFSASTTTENADAILASNGSAGVLQTANSAPVGFMDGAPAQANLNHQARPDTRLAQQTRTGSHS